MLKNLRKQYNNGPKMIHKMLSIPEVTKYGQRKQFKEFTSSRPEFMVEVNPKFELKPHQIRGVNTLLCNWSRGRNMILAD